MSMPKFPEINLEITCDHALNMILASIAMEELALSHIINAEGEKLQYVLGALEAGAGKAPDIDKILTVNQSITCLLDSVSQNQMILKNKMDKAINALSDICPGHSGPACKCTCKCSAVFNFNEKCRQWCAGSALCWRAEHIRGGCFGFDPCDNTKIELRSKGRFAVSFAVNVRNKSDRRCDAAVSLQMVNNHQYADIYTVHSRAITDEAVTVSMGGIIIEPSCHSGHDSLTLRLVSSDSLVVEDSMLSITEI